MVCLLLSACLLCRRPLCRLCICCAPCGLLIALLIAWSATCLSTRLWSSNCLPLHGLFIACRQTVVCLSNRLLQIAQAAHMPPRLYTYIGAENNALYAAAGTMLRGCFLHKRLFAYLLGENRVCLLLRMLQLYDRSNSCLLPK